VQPDNPDGFNRPEYQVAQREGWSGCFLRNINSHAIRCAPRNGLKTPTRPHRWLTLRSLEQFHQPSVKHFVTCICLPAGRPACYVRGMVPLHLFSLRVRAVVRSLLYSTHLCSCRKPVCLHSEQGTWEQ
jgi:hypothetical protein